MVIKKKRELRGIQLNGNINYPVLYISGEFKELIVDCYLGSLVITRDELLTYLEKRQTTSAADKLR
jgi:hypothetical protein